jgi:3-methylcrotonyl-CoA carboxylase alpha subunit
VLATARRLRVPTVAVYSDADAGAAFVSMADEALRLGPAPARDSYLRADLVLTAAAATRATAVHPGYGFLSENAAFADACASAGVAFVGPPAAAIRSMGDKAAAKALMSAAGVPVVPGYHGDDQGDARLRAEADAVGFPLLVKAVSGGGGKGMKLARDKGEFNDALDSARREAGAAFGDERVLLERYVTRPRHVEVQVLADARGGAVYVFDRDCSVQRRHQKIIEEAPAPGLSAEFHAHIGEAAVRAARAVGYVNAGWRLFFCWFFVLFVLCCSTALSPLLHRHNTNTHTKKARSSLSSTSTAATFSSWR